VADVMAVGPNRGTATSLALTGLVALAFGAGGLVAVALSVVVGGALAAAALAAAWMIICIRRPVVALGLLVFAWVLAHARLAVAVLDFAGPETTNRGALSVADLLWVGMIVALLGQARTWRCDLGGLRSAHMWAMGPYVALALALPVVGVVLGAWPLSFATPSLRLAQWLTFLLLGYVMAREHGAESTLRAVLLAILAAGVIHGLYGVMQMAVQLGFLPDDLLVLDRRFADRHSVHWFFFGRATGLLVNPNHYGLFGAFVLTVAVSLIVAGQPVRALWTRLGIAAAIVAIMLTGSRSAVVSLAALLAFWGALAVSGNRAAVKVLRTVPGVMLAGLGMALVAWQALPNVLQARYRRLLALFVEGAGAEQNLTARFDLWTDAWRTYWFEYPYGTWVAPSYALQSPIDSYFVFTAVQGTPALTMLWVAMMLSALTLGLRAYRGAARPMVAAAGLTLAGWVLVLFVSSLTMSPLLQVQLSVPFWVLCGMLLALPDREPVQETSNCTVGASTS
jgi:hypothetical protein